MQRPSLDEIFSDRPSLDDIFAAPTPSAQPTKQTEPQMPQMGDALKGFAGNMWKNAKHGAEALGDFVTMDYKSSDELPMLQELKKKKAAGTANRHDYERAFLESLGNNPGGKILQAAGGLIPEANILTTAVGDYLNPAIVEATGIDPAELELIEMATPAGILAAKKSISPKTAAKTVGEAGITSLTADSKGGGEPPPGGGGLPSAKLAKTAVKGAAHPFLHPIDTAGFIVNSVTKPVLGAVRPAARSIIEADNPITGEPGLKTALASETAKEGTRLGEKMGVEFSAGELTGNPTARGIEDALANSAKWGGRFNEAHQKKVDAIVGNFNDTLTRIYPERVSQAYVGDRLSSAYNGTIDNLIQTRRSQAKIDFDAALKGDEGSATILSNNLFRTLQELKTEGDARLLTADKAEGGKLARQLLSRLTTKTEAGNIQASTITLQELANGLSDFSAASRKPGGLLDDAKSASQRRVYARLAEALQKDLDAEIANPKGSADRAAQLAIARDNFKEFSNQIADVEKTTLGKLVGGAERNSDGELVLSPEKVADKFSAMEPTELRNTLAFLDKNHPDVAKMARRYTLEKALRQATEGRGLRGEGTTKEFAEAEFVKNLPNPERLNALLNDPKAANDIRDVAAAMNRLIDYGARQKGSQTAQRLSFLENIASWGKGAIYRSLVSDSLATDLLSPTKRKQMGVEARKMSKPPKAANQ